MSSARSNFEAKKYLLPIPDRIPSHGYVLQASFNNSWQHPGLHQTPIEAQQPAPGMHQSDRSAPTTIGAAIEHLTYPEPG